jgi:hemerythrin
MTVIKWSNKYSVGIASIDAQHKQLIDMINSLNSAMAKGEANMMISEILSELSEYTRYHFRYEEELFESFDYPQTASHKKKHAQLIDQVSSLKERFESDQTGSIGLEIIQFLKSWLTQHIMKSDKDYADFLLSKGVE